MEIHKGDSCTRTDLSVAAELKLLEFYPREWQVSFYRTSHPWVLHMSLWHYWLWYTFIVGLCFYILFMYKTISYNRADIRGKRATGEKRRLAWSELLICLIPLFWSINIISNAFMYLRVLENTGGYVFLSVQISAYQWGWKYYYGDTIYPKTNSYPTRVGLNTMYATNPNTYKVNEIKFISEVKINNSKLNQFEKNLFYKIRDSSFNLSLVQDSNFFWTQKNLRNIMNFYLNNVTYNFFGIENTYGIGMKGDIYYCRFLLKHLGEIQDSYTELVKNQRFYPGYWITSQGVDANTSIMLKVGEDFLKDYDYLRLFRTTGSIVLPTRVCIRLMSTSEDITHSWAVPGLGIKVDCVPGRLFCIFTNIWRDGVYFGQCSELCGWNHYNMPISVYALSLNHFIVWWELELHHAFNDSFLHKNKIKSKSMLVNICFMNYTNKCNYSLLNWKFK